MQGEQAVVKLCCSNADYSFQGKEVSFDAQTEKHIINQWLTDDYDTLVATLRTQDMKVGVHEASATIGSSDSDEIDGTATFSIVVEAPPVSVPSIQVGLQRSYELPSDHLVLWSMIDHSTQAMSFNGGGQDMDVYRVDKPSLQRLRHVVPPGIVNSLLSTNDSRADRDLLEGAESIAYSESELRQRLERGFRSFDIQGEDKTWYENKILAGLRVRKNGYQQHIDRILCDSSDDVFRGVDAYEKLIEETQQFLLEQVFSDLESEEVRKRMQASLRKQYQGRIGPNFVNEKISEYFAETSGKPVLPYLNSVNRRLTTNGEPGCTDPIQSRLSRPLFIELIWNYWHEENMLNQALQVISLRFQNRSIPGKGRAFDNFAVDPLRRINNLMWGYIQKESSRLSVSRRSNEYDHQYGLRLLGKAVGDFPPAESRSRFIEAFHNLLHLATHYYKEFDDTTIVADSFPLRNALREVHLVLSEGSHNQYGDLPWTARVEMLAQQYILARPEMREFLGGRTMVPYAEPWMDRLDAVKKVMGWGDIGSTYFHDLAYRGERLLLSIRFDQWNDTNIQSSDVASWAEFWRNDIQEYIHAYRSVTGVDLSTVDANNKLDYTLPALLLRQRMKGKSATGKLPVKASSNGQNGKVSKEVFTQHYDSV